MPIHFVVIFVIVVAAAVFAQSWAGVALVVICLLVYYGRQYHRLVTLPKRKMAEQAAKSASKETGS